MSDDIANQLAAEEHLQGKPVGERGHCSYCNEAADAIEAGSRRAKITRLQAECPHDNILDLHILSQIEPIARICDTCGANVAVS